MNAVPRPDISFFFPERGVGGAQYLFVRMARYLIDQGSYQVTIVDYDDGFMRRELGNEAHRFVYYDPGKPVVFDWPTTMVLPLSYISLIGSRLDVRGSTRLFLWDIHPYNLVEQMAFSGFYKRLSATRGGQICALFEPTLRRKLASLVKGTLTHNGMAFMAKRNYEYNRALLGFSQLPLYLPIPIETPFLRDPVRVKQRSHEDRAIHVGWLSRLAPEKTAALYRLIDDARVFSSASGNEQVHLHIIGDGPELAAIRVKTQGLSVTFPGRLEHSALSDYMLEHIDVGFAMGTSALEFSVRGIPSVLTSAGLPQDNLKKERAYRWIFDSEGFDVTAEETSLAPCLRTFGEIVAELRDPKHMRQYGQASSAYALANHGLADVGRRFAQQLALCTFKFVDLKATGIINHNHYERVLLRMKSSYKSLRGSLP